MRSHGISTTGRLLGQELLQPSLKLPLILQLAFPDSQDLPSQRSQFLQVLSIPLPVAFQFRNPVGEIRPRDVCNCAAIVVVPIATVYQDDSPASRENQVRTPRQLVVVEPVAEAHSMYEPPHHHLWSRVLGSDSAHVLASVFWRQPIQIQTPSALIFALIAFA